AADQRRFTLALRRLTGVDASARRDLRDRDRETTLCDDQQPIPGLELGNGGHDERLSLEKLRVRACPQDKGDDSPVARLCSCRFGTARVSAPIQDARNC